MMAAGLVTVPSSHAHFVESRCGAAVEKKSWINLKLG